MSYLDEFATAFLGIFRSHRLDRRPETPIGSLSLDNAYAVQQMVIDRQIAGGEEVVGYKVGCTSRAIRQQFGLSEPICGRVMQPYVYHGDIVLNWSGFNRPAVEPEFVLRIGRDLTDEVGPDEPLADAVESVLPGVEVHNYDWWFGRPSSQELICSNSIHACLVVDDQKISPWGLDWDTEGVGLFKNGELAASGTSVGRSAISVEAPDFFCFPVRKLLDVIRR